MAKPPAAEAATQRRPIAEDIPEVLELVSGGKSLRDACRQLGLHCPSTHTFIDQDDGLREQYARARELRADHFQEDVLTITKAAALGMEVGGKKVDPAGARTYAEAVKWAAARMSPKTAPVQRIDMTSRTRQMSDAEIAAEIAALEAGRHGEG